MFERILVADDGSDGAAKAVGVAIELARTLAVDLNLIFVEELPQLAASIDELVEEKEEGNHRYARIVERASARATAQGVKLTTRSVVGHPVTAIADAVARGRYDLLVIGYMGHSALYNRLIGSTTDRLVEHAPSAVLVVK